MKDNFREVLAVATMFPDRHWCSKWFSQLCHFDQDFLTHVSQQKSGYQHYLCLVKLGFENSPINGRLYQQATIIKTTPKRALLAKLFGKSPNGLLSVLTKLGKHPASRSTYKSLITALEDVNSSKNLQHSDRVYPASLEIICKLPKEIRRCPIVMKLRTNTEAAAFLFMIRSIARIRSDLPINVLARSLTNVKEKSNIHDWFIRTLSRAKFPEPPWEGDEYAAPIRTRKELVETGLKFENCVADYCSQVVLGNTFFYTGVVDSTDYVLDMTREDYVGWRINKITGPRNKDLCKNDQEKVRNRFANVGFDFPSDGEQGYVSGYWW